MSRWQRIVEFVFPWRRRMRERRENMKWVWKQREGEDA
jgi:hypothetical protein